MISVCNGARGQRDHRGRIIPLTDNSSFPPVPPNIIIVIIMRRIIMMVIMRVVPGNVQGDSTCKRRFVTFCEPEKMRL